MPPGTKKTIEDNELRQRNVAQEHGTPVLVNTPATTITRPSTAGGISFIDVLRIIVGLTLVSTVGSYLVTSGESLVWNLRRPRWTTASGLKQRMVRSIVILPSPYKNLTDALQNGGLELTNAELAAYSGADPSKPILIALNRTIYDVSTSPHMYGPKGAYSALAAKDASRAFVTSCLEGADYLVPYLSGVEEIFVPLWLSTSGSQAEYDAIASGESIMSGAGVKGMVEMVQKEIGLDEVAKQREEAYAQGRESVRAKIANWQAVFERKEYPVVGRVVGVDEGDQGRWREIGFCSEALKQRPAMLDSLADAMQTFGKAKGLDLGKIAAVQKDGAGGGQHPAGTHPHSQNAPYGAGGPPVPADHVPNLQAGGHEPHAGAEPQAGANPHHEQ